MAAGLSRFRVVTLPPRAEVQAAAADSILLAVACLISYWVTTRVLSLVYSVSPGDDALGGLWAVVSTVFLFRESYDKSLAAAVSRMAATLVSFALCLAYLAFLSPHDAWRQPILRWRTPRSGSPWAWRPPGWACARSAP